MPQRVLYLIGLMWLLLACEREPQTDSVPTVPPDSVAPATASTNDPRPTDTPSPPINAPAGTFRLSDARIVIAVLNDQSGIYAEFGGKNAVEAVRMAAEDFESRYGKGALGAPIEVLSLDHQNDPEKAAARAQEALDRDGADLLLDVPTSAAAVRVAKIAGEKRRLYINVSAATADLTGKECNRYTFHYAYDIPMLAAGVGSWATQNIGRRWHLSYPKMPFGLEMEAAFRKAIESSGGTILASDPSPFPHPNGEFGEVLRRAAAFHPDAFAALHSGSDLAGLARAYAALKLREQRVSLVAGYLLETDINAVGTDALVGAYFTAPWVWNMDRESRDWSDRFMRRVGTRPTFAHAGNYSAAFQFLEAVRRAGSDQSDAVVKALEGYRWSDVFIRNGTIRADDHLVVHDVYVAQVKSGADVREPWDYARIVATVSADRAARPAASSGCVMR